jgi:hypothetical protein
MGVAVAWLSWPLALLLGVVVGGVAGFVAGVVVRVWPLLRAVWHWALELVLTLALVAAWVGLSAVLPKLAALLVLLGLAGTVAAVRPARRWVVAWWWCVVVRHRLRSAFGDFIRSASRRPGSGPLVLVARPTPAGERVWLWLRPGLELADLDGKTGLLAVACVAAEVRVCRASARYASLVRVDVARRDPVTGVVLSPLPGLLPEALRSQPLHLVPDGPEPDGLELADVPDVPEEPVPARRTSTGSGR